MIKIIINNNSNNILHIKDTYIKIFEEYLNK